MMIGQFRKLCRNGSALSILGDIASQVIQCVATHTGKHVATLNEAMLSAKGRIPNKFVSKTQKISIAESVCHHLTREYYDDLFAQLEAELSPECAIVLTQRFAEKDTALEMLADRVAALQAQVSALTNSALAGTGPTAAFQRMRRWSQA